MFGKKRKQQEQPQEQPQIQYTPEPEPLTQQEIIEDIYEVFQKGLKIHSKRKDIFNEDWTLSELTNNERYFVKEQTRVIALLRNYIIYKEARDKVTRTLMVDIESTLILSRPRQGRLIKGLIGFLLGRREAEALEEQQQKENQGFWSKLFGKSK